jgi:hypothetical protein
LSISKIEDILPRYQEIANGSKKEFSVDFALLEDRFVNVYVDSEKLVSGYKVNVDGGKITFDSAPAKGKNITIVRAVPISWEDTFNGALNSSSLNSLLIYLTASIQTVKEEVSRAVKTSISDNINGGEVSEFFLKQLTDAKDILDKSENTLALLTTTIQDALISIEAARVGAVEDVEALVGRAENTLNGKADLNKNNTFTGTNTFTNEIKRSVALSGGGSHAIKTVDSNGKGETSLISYYTGNRIYNRMLALNYTSSKNAYFEVTVDNNGEGVISFNGSATYKHVNFNNATKVRVPTAQSDAEITEAVNISYLNNQLGGYLPLAGGKMTGTIDFNSKIISNPVAIEFKPLTTANYGGIIDFHYAGSTEDYTSRIIENAEGRIEVTASNGVTVNNKNVVRSVDGTTADSAGNVISNAVKLTGDQTISGTKTFTKQIIRNVPLSGASDWTLRTIDTNGKGYTASVSYYTGGNIINRTVAHNTTADKNAYFDVIIKDDGTANITFNGSATEKYVNFHSATKVRVPTPSSSAENGEAVNIGYLNSILGSFIKGGADYVKIPVEGQTNPLIIQQGTVTGLKNENSGETVTLPTAFATTNYKVMFTPKRASRTINSTYSLQDGSQTTTAFTFHSSYCETMDWIAIGY